jgi:hypothetical protein
MGSASSVMLPEDFRWENSEGGKRLRLRSMDVLEVRRQLAGWVVEILVPQAHTGPNTLVVSSLAAGVRSGSRWARSRKHFLAGLACGNTPRPTRAPAAGEREGPALVPRAPAPVSGHAQLAAEIDEVRRLKTQLDKSLLRLESAYGELLAMESERAAAVRQEVEAMASKLPEQARSACDEHLRKLASLANGGEVMGRRQA